MKRLILLAIAIVILASGDAYAGSETHWDYFGKNGPEHWGELSPEFTSCSTGKNQSPINLAGLVEADLEPLEINYQVGGKEFLNNGHTIYVNFAPGSKISVDGHEFELKQYHFHTPSENQINGKSYPMGHIWCMRIRM